MAWDPAQYLKFAGDRLRPAIDLLNRVDVARPAEVYDLGAGTGHVTRLLQELWPDARVTGVDASPEMLARAEAAVAGIAWQCADLATWQPARPADVIYSNAALHWLGDHDRLFPRLLSLLAPRGVLAVQMPRNFGAPSHTAIAEAARRGPLARHARAAAAAGAGRRARLLLRRPGAAGGRARHRGDRVPPGPRRRAPGQGVDEGDVPPAVPRGPRGAGAQPVRGVLRRAGGPRVPAPARRADALPVPPAVHRRPGSAMTAAWVASSWVRCSWSCRAR